MAKTPMTPKNDECNVCEKPYLRTASRQTCCSSLCAARQSFEKMVIRRAGNECWGWKGFKYKGYGRMGNTLGQGAIGAHRVSYVLHRGPIPDGLTVLHSCDNPECTNPDHLRLGTNADNNIDRDQKQRQAVGERSGKTYMDDETVKLLRKRYRTSDLSMRAVADEFGFPHATVCGILRHRTWRHIS